jgi:SulP family sulfate permease
MASLQQIRSRVKVVLLDMRAVPAIDQTGLVNLVSALARLERLGVAVVLAGLAPQPERVLHRAGIVDRNDDLRVVSSLDEGVAWARAHSAKLAEADDRRNS